MNNKYTIYVISKGRAKKCLTARELTKMNVIFKLVVEDKEYDEYSNIWGDKCEILKLPFSDLGNGSIDVRNWVWNHSMIMYEEKHWILDDNIEGFHRLHENEKYKVSDGTIFRCCEDFTDRYENIGISGMNYHSFCKNTDAVPPFYLNTRIYSCILIDNKIPYKWRGKFNEDTDLSLRILKDGLCTVLFNAFLIGKVTTMRMKGGNTEDVYGDTNNRLEFAQSLAEQHPDVVRVTKKFGRYHHHVNYKPFKTNKLIMKSNVILRSETNNYGMRLVFA